MKGLAVVHTDIRYADPEQMCEAEQNKILFDKIAGEIKQFEGRVYCLPERKIKDIYPAVRELLPRMVNVGRYPLLDEQFLKTKERVMSDKTSPIYI